MNTRMKSHRGNLMELYIWYLCEKWNKERSWTCRNYLGH